MSRNDINQWQTDLLARVDSLIATLQQQPALAVESVDDTRPAKRPTVAKRAKYHYVKAAECYQDAPFRAAKHFRRAAMLGHSKSMRFLGQMYQSGEHLPQSDFHAFAWMLLASKAGDSHASDMLDALKQRLTTVLIIAAARLAAERFEQMCDID
jgi:hypothetical protein